MTEINYYLREELTAAALQAIASQRPPVAEGWTETVVNAAVDMGAKAERAYNDQLEREETATDDPPEPSSEHDHICSRYWKARYKATCDRADQLTQAIHTVIDAWSREDSSGRDVAFAVGEAEHALKNTPSCHMPPGSAPADDEGLMPRLNKRVHDLEEAINWIGAAANVSNAKGELPKNIGDAIDGAIKKLRLEPSNNAPAPSEPIVTEREIESAMSDAVDAYHEMVLEEDPYAMNKAVESLPSEVLAELIRQRAPHMVSVNQNYDPNARVRDLYEKCQNWHTKANGLEKQLEARNEEIKRLRMELDSAKAHSDANIKAAEYWKGNHDSAEAALSEAHKENRRLTDKLADYSNLNSTISDNEQALAARDEEIERLKQPAVNGEPDAGKWRKTAEQWERVARDRDRNLEEYEEALRNREDAIKNLHNVISGYEKDLAERDNEIAERAKKLDQLQKEKDRVVFQNPAESAANHYQDAFEQARQEVVRLQAQRDQIDLDKSTLEHAIRHIADDAERCWFVPKRLVHTIDHALGMIEPPGK